ncbi:hypothetical protein [Nostoc sp.]|uniref:hypothetical protein n=1 Tax=Nostoc sp. TaxID=1180 RepID=UPI002FF66458
MCILGVAAPAASAVIRVEPDDFGTFTPLTNAVPGVTLSIDSRPELSIISYDMFGVPSTGTRLFGIIGLGGEQAEFYLNTEFRADFNKLADSVSIDFIGANPVFSTFGKLLAFNSNGNLLDSFFTDPLARGQIQSGVVTSTGFQIAYVVASITEGSQSGTDLDNLVANVASVPESSSTLGILSISTLGAGLALKRKLKQKLSEIF